VDYFINQTNKYSGEIKIPASKSYAQRAIACALISDERSIIHGLGASEDERSALNVLYQSKINPVYTEDTVCVPKGNKLNFNTTKIDFGESGLSSRMFTPILANCQQEFELIGNGSLVTRPMLFFEKVMADLNVSFKSDNGYLPFKMHGPLIPKTLHLDGSLSSQFITGFIYAFVGNSKTRNEKIHVKNAVSIPYIELSIKVLNDFGVCIDYVNETIHFNGPYDFKEAEIAIEGDWSSASFLLVGAALFGSVTIKGLQKDSKQADACILDVLSCFGATVKWMGTDLMVTKNNLNSFELDASNCPDLFPPLAVLGSYGSGVSRIYGVNRLFSKESNRAITIVNELNKLGAKIEIRNDMMLIYPRNEQQETTVSSCFDHRIAMACAIFALGLKSNVCITNAAVVKKSFPTFFSCLETLIR
jgi:3-phosphoshikimate 1-carboxyvinyltransferase